MFRRQSLEAPARDSQDDLDLRLDDQRVQRGEAVDDFVELHELLPPPIVLLLAEPVQCVFNHAHAHAHTGMDTKGSQRQLVKVLSMSGTWHAEQ